MAEQVRGISVVKGTEGREGGNSSGSGSIDKDHSLSVKTVSEFRALPVDPLVTFLTEATRPGKIIVADHSVIPREASQPCQESAPGTQNF
jgi:hypothetical protein